MRRGQVWWADLPPPFGRRPVLLLSRNSAYRVRDLIIVAPITTRIRGIPAKVPLGPDDGLPRACVVNVDAIYTVSKRTFHRHIASLGSEKLQDVEDAIHFALGLDT